MMDDHGLLVLRHLAENGRRILTRWRAHLILRQEVDPLFKESRANRVVNRLREQELITALEGNRKKARIFQVTTPYVRKEVSPYEVFAEAYYGAFFCYATAFQLHRLSDQRARILHMLMPSERPSSTLRARSRDELADGPGRLSMPIGSELSDWRAVEVPRFIWIEEAAGHEASPHQTKTEWLFGWEEAEVDGVPIRRADQERALIDGLREPGLCGGLNEVFRAWVRAREEVDRDRLTTYGERFGRSILYQRLGFVMETLGLEHPALERWKANQTQRGGSRLLDPSGEYSSTYSEEWALSINHPISILETEDPSYS